MRNNPATVTSLDDFRRAVNHPSYPSRNTMSFEQGELLWLLTVRQQFNARDSLITDSAINTGCSNVASFVVYAKGDGGQIDGDVTFEKSFEFTKGGIFYTVVKNGAPSFGTKDFRDAKDIFRETIADSYGSPLKVAQPEIIEQDVTPEPTQESNVIRPSFWN